MSKEIIVDYNTFKHYQELMDKAQRNMDKIVQELTLLSTKIEKLDNQYRYECQDFWQAERELQKIFSESAYLWFKSRVEFCAESSTKTKDMFDDYKKWCISNQMPYTEDYERFLWRLNNIKNEEYLLFVGNWADWVTGVKLKELELDKGSEDSGKRMDKST